MINLINLAMEFDCKFDSVKDVMEVDQFGFVDLREVMETGVVPSDSSVQDSEYLDQDDPTEVNGRPSSPFEMIDAGVDLTRRIEAAQAAAKSSKDGAD